MEFDGIPSNIIDKTYSVRVVFQTAKFDITYKSDSDTSFHFIHYASAQDISHFVISQVFKFKLFCIREEEWVLMKLIAT